MTLALRSSWREKLPPRKTSHQHLMTYLHLIVILFASVLIKPSREDCGGRNSGKPVVESKHLTTTPKTLILTKPVVLLWSGGTWAGFTAGEYFKTPNYLGHDVDKCKFDLLILRWAMCN